MALHSLGRRILIFCSFLLAGILIGVFAAWVIYGSGTGLEPPAMAGTGNKTRPCGEFRLLDLDVRDTYSLNGIDVKLGFAFIPSTPGCESSCDSIGFVQIVRTLDLDNPKRFYYPSTQKRQRATSDGWYIDRGEGYKWVYYGRRNDGGFAAYVTLGTASDQAALSDRPYRPENHPFLGIRWQAVTVPVCIDADREGDQHGYYAWSWTVTRRGSVVDVKYIVANESLIDDVRQALSQWNDEAGRWGTREYPSPAPITEKLTIKN